MYHINKLELLSFIFILKYIFSLIIMYKYHFFRERKKF